MNEPEKNINSTPSVSATSKFVTEFRDSTLKVTSIVRNNPSKGKSIVFSIKKNQSSCFGYIKIKKNLI